MSNLPFICSGKNEFLEIIIQKMSSSNIIENETKFCLLALKSVSSFPKEIANWRDAPVSAKHHKTLFLLSESSVSGLFVRFN